MPITQPKRMALLAYLALAEPAGFHPRDVLLALLWPEADTASARHSLRNALHSIRQAVGTDAVITRGDGYVGLDLTHLTCDAVELRKLARAGKHAEAVARWSGDPLPGFHVAGAPEFEHWLDATRDQLRRLVVASAWVRVTELGRGQDAIDAARQACAIGQADEAGVRRLMRLLIDHGDRAGALQVYRDLAERIHREFGSTPSPETVALSEMALVAEPATPARPMTATDRSVPAVIQHDRRTAPTTVVPTGTRRRRAPIAVAIVAMLALGSIALSRQRPKPVEPEVYDEATHAALRLPAQYRRDTSAYSSYLRGLTLRFAFKFVESRDTLGSLVDRKPLYVPGIYGLAQAWIFTALNDLTDPDEAWTKVDALARRALALDSASASAWLALAARDMFDTRDLTRAGERILRARAIDPLDPDVPGVRSAWFRILGQMDSSVAEARRAHQLDPMSPLLARLEARQLYLARRYDESLVIYRRMLRDDPTWSRGYRDMVDLMLAMKRPREAVEWQQRVRLAAGDSVGAAAMRAATSDQDAWTRLEADARRTAQQLEVKHRSGARITAATVAKAYAIAGDTVRTLDWLDSMLVFRDSYALQVGVDPLFDLVRGEDRHAAWIRRAGLVEATTKK